MVTDYEGTIGEDIPAVVNGWTYDPDAAWNGDAWRNESEQVALVVFDHGVLFGSSFIKVYDERIGGMKNNVCIEYSPEINDDWSITPTEAREKAIAWMKETRPGEWVHPLVQEPVFNPPHGFSVEHYYIESREDIVIYQRDRLPEGLLSQKIQIEGYRSTGNYTVTAEEYGEQSRGTIPRFTRELEDSSMGTAVDMTHVIAAKLLTTPHTLS